MKELIGWASSFVLVLTISKQVYKQWKSGTSEGVSKWLYIGQMAASTGFTTYSVLVHDWVFVVTNAVMLVAAIVGFTIYHHHKRADVRRSMTSVPPRPALYRAASSDAS